MSVRDTRGCASGDGFDCGSEDSNRVPLVLVPVILPLEPMWSAMSMISEGIMPSRISPSKNARLENESRRVDSISPSATQF